MHEDCLDFLNTFDNFRILLSTFYLLEERMQYRSITMHNHWNPGHEPVAQEPAIRLQSNQQSFALLPGTVRELSSCGMAFWALRDAKGDNGLYLRENTYQLWAPTTSHDHSEQKL